MNDLKTTMKNSGTLIISCIVAAAAGVAVGMLLAPEKGEDLRKNLREKLSDLMGDDKDASKSPQPGDRVTSTLDSTEAPVAS